MFSKALTCLEDTSAQHVSNPFMTQGKMCEDTLLRRQVRESWIALQEAGGIDSVIQNWKCLPSDSGHYAFKWRLPSGTSLPGGNVLLEKKRRHFKLELVSAMHHHYKFSIDWGKTVYFAMLFSRRINYWCWWTSISSVDWYNQNLKGLSLPLDFIFITLGF